VLDALARGLTGLRERIGVDREWSENLQQETLELQGVEARLREAGAALRTVFEPGADAFPLVRWLERRGGAQETTTVARAAPVALAEALRESLFDRVDTTVLTSATLTTRDGFAFVRGRLGLHDGLRIRESTHPSPFDYASRTVVAIPTDVPIPGGSVFDETAAAVTEDLARLSDGGIFVLFTSYRSMRAVASTLRRRGTEGRWPLFVQGEAPRTKLLDRFRASGGGVLLGVTSFWEGVDVPGESLRGLILAKLPFKVPTEPLTAARMEALEADGGNGFTDYMLPLAALRLKQGFGRLVRTRTDRGAVVILDRRIRERGYGRYLLDALPGPPVRTGTWPILRDVLRQFYEETA
jgi:ATP-dependent DNA helicase DinG